MPDRKRGVHVDGRPRANRESLTQAAADGKKSKEKYVLSLYVSGTTSRSARAVEAVKKTCEQCLHGRYELQVVDVYLEPQVVRREQIVAAPTLVKALPLPLRRLIGDMTDKEHLLLGLGLEVVDKARAG